MDLLNISDQELWQLIKENSDYKIPIVAKIEKPDDDLIFALILKNFSDLQIQIDKNLSELINREGWNCHEKATAYRDAQCGIFT